MKKLTKKSLDELAEIMPVISEKNQQECVGGFYFIGGTGDYLGSNSLWYTAGGPQDDFLVVSGSDMSGYNTAVSHNNLSAYHGGVALTIQNFSEQQLCNIYMQFSSGYSFSGTKIVECNYSSEREIYIDESNQLVFRGDFSNATMLKNAWVDFISGITGNEYP